MAIRTRDLVKIKKDHPEFAWAINFLLVKGLKGRLKQVYNWTTFEINAVFLGNKLSISIAHASKCLKELYDMGLLTQKETEGMNFLKYKYRRVS